MDEGADVLLVVAWPVVGVLLDLIQIHYHVAAGVGTLANSGRSDQIIG